MAKVTGLSGNEIYCMALKGYSAGELVVGNSVNSMGFLGGIGAGVRNLLGGEVPQVTQAIEEGRINAFNRMVAEAKREGASGI
ncbi:MAG TPA: heavy metal-binding domain-containing protein, partial [Aestuariivirga sp.]